MGRSIVTRITLNGAFMDTCSISFPKVIRENKGNSLFEFPESFTVIDLETTGLTPLYDKIIEVSAIKVRHGKITDQFSSLVNQKDVYIDGYITALTGITQEMLDNSPSIEDVFPKYIEFISGDIVLGHNVNFDVNFIYDECRKEGLPDFKNDFVDTMRLSRRLHPEFKHHRLKDLSNRYKLNPSGSHRGLVDCETTLLAFDAVKKDAMTQHGSIKAFIDSLFKKASEITAHTDIFDESHPLYQKICVFTGKLERMTRTEAMQIVADLGGINGKSVTKETNYLILGNNDYCTSIKDGKSIKQKKAEQLKLEGQDIEILSEDTFYDMI